MRIITCFRQPLFLGVFLGFSVVEILSRTAEASVEIMSYNVQNLFDALDDPETNDQEFLPGGRFRWTDAKIDWKIKNLSASIVETTATGIRCPHILILQEVENEGIVTRLRDQGLSKCKYISTIVEKKSPDPRGIRVAILSTKPLLEIPRSLLPYPGGRSMIEAHFNVDGKRLVVFGNHWKSRASYGGNSKDDGTSRRRQSAQVLRKRIESLQEYDPDLEFIVAGDLNDEPENPSIAVDLGAERRPLDEIHGEFFLWQPSVELSRFLDIPEIQDLSIQEVSDLFRKLRGTYYYSKAKIFNQLDHLLVSSSLLDNQGLRYVLRSYEVVRRKPFTTPAGTPLSFDALLNPRSNEGVTTRQGASDHFPIRLRLESIQED